MTALFTRKAYKPSVSSFQLTVLCTLTSVFSILSTYIDCNVLNEIVFVITAMFRQTVLFPMSI